MSRVKEIQDAIEALSEKDYAALRKWFSEKDWEKWDRQIEIDSETGLLAGTAGLSAHAMGADTFTWERVAMVLWLCLALVMRAESLLEEQGEVVSDAPPSYVTSDTEARREHSEEDNG